MCRFLAYIGKPVLANDLLYRPTHSLIERQSLAAQEMSIPINGDGFGISWYDFNLDDEPCQFRSVRPAWSDENLRHLAKKVRTNMLFTHIRAATPGSTVEEINCHPFIYGKLTWMHNGMVQGFRTIRRALLRELRDEAYDAVSGSTDSEHLFGLFLNNLRDPGGPVSTQDMVDAMYGMFNDFNRLLFEHDVKEHSYLNLCVSNGRSVIATRYTTNPRVQPASLYYMFGREYVCDNDRCTMLPDDGHSEAIVISSEPFTGVKSDWIKVTRNSMLIVDEDLSIRFADIELPFEKATFVYEE
ncbi:MAG: class II glutamine amidotransferase [Bacteroidetes bacterium]|nr:class II glutamine amidotransferase [Bacteroidota bacterium]